MSQSVTALPEHIQWLAQHRGTALRQRLVHDGVHIGIHDALDIFMQADPDPGLRATQWLVDAYLDGRMLWEDVSGGASSKACETLELFAQHRARIQGRLRNLANHTGLASLYTAIQPYLQSIEQDENNETPTGRALRRAQRAQARAESTTIHESPELRLVVPHTQFAAQWWGRGTRWCTAAESNNMFKTYNGDAPLLIAVLPQTRFQMWIGPEGNFQFMDEADAEVDREVVEQHWSSLQPLVEWACTRLGSVLRLVPPHARTRALCTRAVANDGRALVHVPQDLRDDEMCRIALEQDHRAFAHFPKRLQTLDACLSAIEGCPPGRRMDWIPSHLRTTKTTRASIARNGRYLYIVPASERTLDIFISAIKSFDLESEIPIGHGDIPRKYRVDVYDCAQAQGHMALGLLSEDQITPDIAMRAVQSHARALKHIPANLRTPELCRAAIEAHGTALQYLGFNLRSPELCRLAVEQNPIALTYVTYSAMSAELCILALQGALDGRIQVDTRTHTELNILHMIPPAILTDAMYTMALRQPRVEHYPPIDIRKLPPEFRTRQMCLDAVGEWGSALEYVPGQFRDQEMCTLAMQSDARLARPHVPQHLQEAYALPTEPLWTLDTKLADLPERIHEWLTELQSEANTPLPAPPCSLGSLSPAG